MFLLYFISILFLYYLGSFPPPVFAVDFLFTFISLFGFISLSSGDRDFDSRNDFLQPIGTSGQASRWDKPTVHPRCRNLPDHEDPQCYSHFFFSGIWIILVSKLWAQENRGGKNSYHHYPKFPALYPNIPSFPGALERRGKRRTHFISQGIADAPSLEGWINLGSTHEVSLMEWDNP